MTASSSYHEEEWRAHVSEELRSVGGDRVDSSAPGQRVEPRLADHIQVGGDVVGGVLTATQAREKGPHHFLSSALWRHSEQ